MEGFHIGQSGAVYSAATASTVPILAPTMYVQSGIAYWGSANTYPQEILKAATENSLIPATINYKARALYSAGIAYGYKTVEDGIEKIETVSIPEVEEFFRNSNIRRYLFEAANDFYYFGNVFAEIIFNNGLKKAASISVQEAMFCRFSAQNTLTGKIEKVIIDANWGNSGATQYRTEVPVIDPYSPKSSISKAKGYKYIYPVSEPSPGQIYYQIPPWHSAFSSGWVGVSNAIPKIKKLLLEKGLSAKYHIQIPDYWWLLRFPDWESMTSELRIQNQKTVFTEVDEFLLGLENAGKTLITSFATDMHTKDKYAGWSISLIEQAKDGQNIEDSQEASAHILFALGVPSTLLSNNVKGGMGAGSGSDVREHFNAYLALAKTHEDIILEPLYFIRDFNGWPENLEFWFKRPLLRAQNEITPAQR